MLSSLFRSMAQNSQVQHRLYRYLGDCPAGTSNSCMDEVCGLSPFLLCLRWLRLFSNSVEGANASAVVYIMVEMAKAHNLNIYGYLKFLLEHRPNQNMSDEQLAELPPWSEKLQAIKNRI